MRNTLIPFKNQNNIVTEYIMHSSRLMFQLWWARTDVAQSFGCEHLLQDIHMDDKDGRRKTLRLILYRIRYAYTSLSKGNVGYKIADVDCVTFQVPTAASIKMTAFWDVAQCSLFEVDRSTSETSVYFNETARRYIPEGFHIRSSNCSNLKHSMLCFMSLTGESGPINI
jgi:hypothetical protein